MSSISSCNLIQDEDIIKLYRYILTEQLDKGKSNPQQMLSEFYEMINSQNLNYEDKIIWIANYLKILNRVVNELFTAKSEKDSKLVENFEFEGLRRLYTQIGLDIDNTQNPIDTIEKLDAYIQNEYVVPVMGERQSDSEEHNAKGNVDDVSVEEDNEPVPELNSDPLFEQDILEEETEAREYSNHVQNTPAGIKFLESKQRKQTYVAVERLGQITAFKFDVANRIFQEISPDLKRNDITGHELTLDEFLDRYTGSPLVQIPSIVESSRQNDESKNSNLRAYYGNVISRFMGSNSIVTFFGNAIKAKERALSLFGFNKDKFEVGPLAQEMGTKNKVFKKLFKRGKHGSIVLDQVTLDGIFESKGHSLFLEINDDPSLENKQVVLTVKKDDKDVMVLGNVFDLDQGNANVFNDVENGTEYSKFLQGLIGQLNSSKTKSLNVTNMGIKVNKVFLPGQKNGEANKIYANDQDRFGKDADVTKAQNLSLRDGIKLLGEMGYAVSDPMVDKNISNSSNPGGAYVAVSPFHNKETIDGILSDAFGQKDSMEASTMQELSQLHNISFIFLERKKLKLSDYISLTKNNTTVNRILDANGEQSRDYTKRQSIFNVGQSALLHYRFAKAIPYMEEALRKDPSNKVLQKNILMLKVFLFNNQDYYTTDKSKRQDLKAFQVSMKKFHDTDSPEVDFGITATAEANYQAWLTLESQRDGMGKNRQLNKSKEFASKLFGYFPSENSSDPLDMELMERKNRYAEWASQGDPAKLNLAKRQGGIFGSIIMTAIKDMSKMKGIKLNGKTLEEEFDNESGFIGDLEITNEVKAMTFNPVVENKNNSGAILGRDSSSVMGLRSEVDGTNLLEDYLELPYLPLMPHLYIEASGELKNPTPPETTKRKRKSKASREVFDDNGAFKTIDSEGLIEASDYQLTEKETLEIYESVLGELKGQLDLIGSPIVVSDGMVVGQVGKNILKLLHVNGKMSESVLRHEIMHRIVNEVLSAESRRKLYQAAKKHMLKLDSALGSVQQITDQQADEFIAENYENNHKSYGSKFVKNLPKILKDFYFALRTIYASLTTRLSYMDIVAEKASAGIYVNAELNQNAYLNNVSNKKILFDRKNLADQFNSDRTLGTQLMTYSANILIQDVQNMLFGNTIAQDMQNGVEEATRLLSFKEGLDMAKEEIVFSIAEILETDEELKEPEDELSIEERRLFIPDDLNFELESDLGNINHDLSGIDYHELSPNGKHLLQRIVTLRNFEAIAKIAVPFVDYGANTEVNDSGQTEIEQDLENETEGEMNNLVGDKLRNSFERSEISAYGTFTEKVKFFLYNTRQFRSKFLVNRKHVDNYFSLITQQMQKESATDGEFDLNLFLAIAKQQVDKLDPNVKGGGFEYSEAYRSTKAIYDRFFNPDTTNGYSFLAISLLDDPRFADQAKAHGEIVAAIISAQKSVVQQNFLKLDRDTLSETDEGAGKQVKNAIKDSVAFRVFKKDNKGNKLVYKLSGYIKNTFIWGKEYRLGNHIEGLSFSVGENSVVLTGNDISKSASMFDINSAGVDKLLTLFPNDSSLLVGLNAMGFGLSEEYFNSLIANDTSSQLGKRRLIELFFQSHAIIARQHIDESKSEEFGGKALDIIKKLSTRRNENIHKIFNEAKQKDKLASNFKEGENSEDLNEASEFNAFSPTVLYDKLVKLANSSALSNYEKKDKNVFLMDGSKETVDKYPTTMHRVMSRWQDFGRKVMNEYEDLIEAKLLPTDAEGNPIPLAAWLKQKYKGIHSAVYQNPMVLGTLNHKGVLYYKGQRNGKTNRSRSFTDATETETLMDLLKFMIGDGFNGDYYHAKDLQADRGFLILLKIASTKLRPSRFFAKKGKPDAKAMAELENIRRIPFHHALNSMIEAYTILGETNRANKLNGLLDSDQFNEEEIKEAFEQYDLKLIEIQKEENHQIIFDTLAERKHYIKVGGQYRASPLLKNRMAQSHKDFIADFEKKFLEFGEYAKSHLYNLDVPSEGKIYLSKEKLGDVDGLTDERFEGKNGIRWFTEEGVDPEKYDAMSDQDKINSYHPALYSIFMTYFINQTHIAQATTGDLYLYKADKSTGPGISHSYMTDFIKRQATFTTPKIEGMHRQEITVNGQKRIVNKRALGTSLNIAVFSDVVFDAVSEAPEFAQSFIDANGIQANEDGSYNSIEQESTDGYIAMTPIMESMMKASYGGENGMNVGKESKFNLHGFDPKTGNLILPKGLAQVITGDFLNMSTPFVKGLVKAMYSPANIQMTDGTVLNLWDAYENLLAEYSDDPSIADAELVELYHQARNNENGMALLSDIVHFMPAKSTNKGVTQGLNRFDSEGTNQFDQTQYTTASTEGFGIILDLQKDIDKKKNEVSLSTQMLFLAGINGQNYKKAFSLYNRIARMSTNEIDKIATQVANLFDKNLQNNNGIMKNMDAVRKWMIREIKNAFETKNDFGLIYQLVEDLSSAAVSNPLLYEEIFQKVGSTFSKAIKMKMNGFKSVHAPAHNIVMLYQAPIVDAYGQRTTKWLTKQDVLKMGLDPNVLVARNTKYSFKQKDTLTDTEIVTGNVFVGKYKLSEKYTINDIFSLSMDGQAINVEADQYDRLAERPKARLKWIKESIANGSSVDWASSPIVQAMINTKKINQRIINRINTGEALTDYENEYMFDSFANMADEMNRQLYGVITRIPATGKNSSTPFRIKGFVTGYKNGSFLPSEWFKISGADNDGDTVQLWHYGSDNEIEIEALTSIRSILKDIANEKEIFAQISLDYLDNLSADKKRKMLETSSGFSHGSLKTVVQMKGNNSVGVEQTGINATQSKVHAYSMVAKRILNDLYEKIHGEGVRVEKEVDRFYYRNEAGELVEMNTGPLHMDADGNAFDANGEFLYKWNEILTNGAIDNAKHLSIDSTNINRYNSNIQQAMTFFGFPKEAIVSVLKNPYLTEVFTKMKYMDNISNDYSPQLKKTLTDMKYSDGNYGAQHLSDFYAVGEGESNGKNVVSMKKIKEYFQSIEWTPDFNNPKDVLAFTLLMDDASNEINLIRKIITVTDSIGGKSTKQESAIENILDAANLGFTKDKILTGSSLLSFLKSNAGLTFSDPALKADQYWHKNPYTVEKVLKGDSKAYFVHPLALMMSLPHVREFAIAHLEFNETKNTHLIDSPVMKSLRKETMLSMDSRLSRIDRNRSKVTKSLYKLINAEFLKKKVGKFEFGNEVYDFASVKDVYRFRKDFANFVLDEKTSTKNLFLRRLEVSPGSIIFPSAEKMDSAMKQIPTSEFLKLSPQVKKAFFLFEITSGDTQLQYKKGSYATFMDASVFSEYNSWLRSAEIEQNIIDSAGKGRRFLKTFAYENPSLMNKVYSFLTNFNDPTSNSTYLFDTPMSKIPQKVLYKAENIREFDMGMFDEETAKKVDEVRTVIADLQKEESILQEAHNKLNDPTLKLENPKADLFKAKLYLSNVRAKIDKENRKVEALVLKNLSKKGAGRYRVVKGYDKATKSYTSRLFEVRAMTAEELEASPKKVTYVDGKKVYVPEFMAIMEEVMIPFETDISMYLLEDSIPKVIDSSKIYSDYESLLKDHAKNPLAEGTYFTGEYDKVEIVDGMDPNVKKFSFRNSKGEPSSRKKIESVIKLVRRVFPNIKVELVSGLTGVHADVAGFVHKNTVYLNMDNIGMETPIHEFAHVFVDLIQMNNPALFKTIERLVTKTAMFERIEKKYTQFNNTHADNVKETFVTMLGLHFGENESGFLEDYNKSDKTAILKAFDDVIQFIKDKVKLMLSELNIRKQYVNENLINKLDMSSDLEDMFKAISGAVIQGEVITALSTKELNEIEQSMGLNKDRATNNQVLAVIADMVEKGLIKHYC